MFVFLLRRLLQACIVMLIISLLSFVIQGNLGDPVRQMVGQSVTSEEVEKIRQEQGLNDSFFQQYGRYIKNALHGDFGESYFYKEPAFHVIMAKLPATIELTLAAIILTIVIAIPCGVFTAIRPKNLASHGIMFFSTIGLSTPIFITAILLLYVFSALLQWTPSFGRGETVSIMGLWESGFFSLDGLYHLILPSISLSFILAPLFIRLIRSEMLEIMESEYIKYAKAKGLSSARVYFIHALKNIMLPIITIGGIQIGNIIAYTILTETVFQWPGMGSLFIDSINRVDTPVISAYLMVVGVIFVFTNTLVDLVYGLFNPTVKLAVKDV
ncbi:ABC transporter permease [Marinomonas agarivorans]|nr:ABC transporter permease [Marinomonas agarivorans]